MIDKNVKVCAVCAVKGGVGKTLISLNLARRLSNKGKVALIDCDVDNSNFATFTGCSDQIEITPDKKYKPYDWDGIKVFSISLLAGKDKGISMTGDRYAQILDDAVNRSEWGDLDYIVLDLPAGSGDIFKIAMYEFVDNLVGNVIVSQPSMEDATKRTLNLHRYLDIPVIGLIENMSYFECTRHKTPIKYYLFGESHAEELAKQFDVDFLGRIPLSEKISKNIAQAKPFIPDEYAKPIDRAIDKIVKSPIAKTSLAEKIKQPFLSKVKAELQKVLIALLLRIKKDFNVDEIRRQKGFTHEKPFLLVITDETGRKELVRLPMKLTAEGFKVIKRPKGIDFEIITDYKTIARAIMGTRRVGGKLVPFRAEDAWFMGDVRVYGAGHSTYAIDALRKVFSDESLMNAIREKYGNILSRWI